MQHPQLPRPRHRAHRDPSPDGPVELALCAFHVDWARRVIAADEP